MKSSLVRRADVLLGLSATENTRFFLQKTNASDSPASGTAGSSGESPRGGPGDDWKTRWALYFLLGVLLVALLYFLAMIYFM